MPFAIDEEKMQTDIARMKPGSKPLVAMDPAKPPIKTIPHMEFPMVVYKHPKEPFKKIEHRNAHHEIVEVETLPAEHLTRIVNDKRELEAATKEGWVRKPFIAPANPDPNAGLYE